MGLKIEYYNDGITLKCKCWTDENGDFHRSDGPAFIQYSNGGLVDFEYWFIHGYSHREDGPADIEYYMSDRSVNKRWFLWGRLYYEIEHGDLVALGKSIVSINDAILNCRHKSRYIRMKCQEVLNASN
jgi:hypothetical protein